MVLHSPGLPQIHCVAKDDPELMLFLLLHTLSVVIIGKCHHMGLTSVFEANHHNCKAVFLTLCCNLVAL